MLSAFSQTAKTSRFCKHENTSMLVSHNVQKCSFVSFFTVTVQTFSKTVLIRHKPEEKRTIIVCLKHQMWKHASENREKKGWIPFQSLEHQTGQMVQISRSSSWRTPHSKTSGTSGCFLNTGTGKSKNWISVNHINIFEHSGHKIKLLLCVYVYKFRL